MTKEHYRIALSISACNSVGSWFLSSRLVMTLVTMEACTNTASPNTRRRLIVYHICEWGLGIAVDDHDNRIGKGGRAEQWRGCLVHGQEPPNWKFLKQVISGAGTMLVELGRCKEAWRVVLLSKRAEASGGYGNIWTVKHFTFAIATDTRILSFLKRDSPIDVGGFS